MTRYTAYTGDELARAIFNGVEIKTPPVIKPVRSVPLHQEPLSQKTQPWKDGSVMARISRLFDNMGDVGWKDTPPHVAVIYAQCTPSHINYTGGNLEATARKLDRRESLVGEHDINNSEFY